MTSIRETIRRYFSPVVPLPSGIYHYQPSSENLPHHRMHLRLEKDGSGILLVNATTVLHLNQTAAEYAYHVLSGTPMDKMVQEIARRYRVSRQQAYQDYHALIENIDTLIQMPDLDPEIYIGGDRATPLAQKLTAPLRLDCALTYQLPGDVDPSMAPKENVKRELSTEEWSSIINKAWSAGIPHITFTGGEPTLRDDLPALIAQAEFNGQVSGLLSDGLRFADNEYLDHILNTGLDYLLITFQPNNKLSWQALTNVLAADLFVAVHLTITLSNAIDAPDLLTTLAQKGVKNVSLSTSDSTLHSTLSSLRNQVADLGMSLVWNLPVPYSAFNPVTLETQEDLSYEEPNYPWLYVEPDGDVLPGQGVHQVLGNILNDSWETLWQYRR